MTLGRLARFVVAGAAVGACFALRLAVGPYIEQDIPMVLFAFAVAVSAFVGGLWPGIVAVLASVVLADLYFIHPIGSLSLPTPAEGIELGVFALTGVVVSVLAEGMHHVRRADAALLRADLRQQRARTALDQSKSALRLSQQRVELALSAGGMGTWEWDITRDTVVWSQEIYKLFGLAREEFGNSLQAFMDRIVPEDQENVRVRLQRALEHGDTYEIDCRIVRGTDNATRWMYSKGLITRDDSGRPIGILGICFDQTERKQIEQTLLTTHRNTAQRLRIVADTLPQLVWITRPDGYHEYYNQRWYEYIGADFEHSKGDRWADPLHPEDRERSRQRWSHALETGEPYEIEYRFRRHDGMYRWFLGRAMPLRDSDGRIMQWFGTCTDIDDQKRAEAALRESEHRLRLAVEAARLGTWETSLRTNLISGSETFKAVFGLSPDAVMTNEMLQAMIHPDDRERRSRALSQALASRGVYDCEYRFLHPDGGMRWASASGQAMYAQDGTPIRMIGVIADITERRRIEAEREELLRGEQNARRDAEQASRLKDDFLATLSHELRTPLNAMLGWSQVIRRGSRDWGTVSQGLEVIERNARTQARLIEELLDMSSILSGKLRLDRREIELAPVVSAGLAVCRPSADAKGIGLTLTSEPRSANVFGDAARLQQVVWNLVSNAIKFTPKGGLVSIALQDNGPYLELRVTDNGQGIQPDFLPFVFDRFRQADSSITRNTGGLGLGLAIVKQLVELHGGSVRAESAGENRGTTFVVELPALFTQRVKQSRLTQASYGGRSDDGPAEISDSLKGVRVLVVDDERDTRELVQHILERQEAQVLAVSSAREGLERIQAFHPDVLLSDIGMPELDGYDFMRKIRSSPDCARVPAVALTAFAHAEDRQRALLAGYHTHLAKPVEPSALIELVVSLARSGDDRADRLRDTRLNK